MNKRKKSVSCYEQVLICHFLVLKGDKYQAKMAE